jgi:hypothetical protein
MTMVRRFIARAGVLAVMLAGAGCRPQTQSWPDQPADLAGRVLDVELVPGELRRLHIRVASSRRAAPGTDAYIGLDGVTQLTRGGAGSDDGAPELQGAFVRVWFRGPPRTSTPVETVAMARLVAIDSVAARDPSR